MPPQALTPYILLDASTVRRNLAQLAQYTSKHKLGVRPHAKTHKSTFLARMQLENGAIGLTVAKSGEAQVMAQVCDDLLMAYPALDAARCQTLAELAKARTVRLAIDSTTAADAIASAASAAGTVIGILVDLDVGLHRTGVQGAQEALALAQYVSKKRGLRLDGLLFYPGQLGSTTAGHEVALAAIDQQLAEVLDLWRKSGLEAKVISGGSTPTAYNSHLVTRMSEIRPGTYLFNDMNCVKAGCCTLGDCAARIVTTVISTAVPDQIVLDSGSKTLTSDRCGPAPESGHGHILEYPEAKITKLSEEHAQVDVTRCQRRPKVGDRVSVIPNHICPCVNLQDTIWWREENESLRPLPVEARGRVY